MKPAVSSQYRPDIDGLRAFAVLAVVVFHAFPSALPAGFVGVDVFFVISGYLITGILLRELATNEYSLLAFYGRRFRRIIPALILVVIATWIAGRLFLLTDDFRNLGRYVVAAATFTSNIALWREAGYFDAAAETKPLLHLWSLAVEEQFYVVWPLLVAACTGKRKMFGPLLLALLAISFGANLYFTGRDTAASFYLLPTRFWELLAGGLLAYRQATFPSTNGKESHDNALSIIGISLIALSVSGVVGTQPFPGWRAILPVLGSVLLIAAGPKTWLARHVLSNRLAVAVGLISYPLYLWHWPLLSIARLVEGAPPQPLLRAGLVAAAVALAWLTWRFVERPAQSYRPQRMSRKQLSIAHVTAAVAGMAIMGTLGAMTQRDMLLSSAQRDLLVIGSYRNLPASQHGREACLLQPEQTYTNFPTECYATSGKPVVLIWGDSFANHLYPGIAEAMGASRDILTLTASSCPPVIGFTRDNRPNCEAINSWAMSQIKRIRPDIVVMQAIWYYDLKSDRFIEKLDATIQQLFETGVSRVIVAGQLPVWVPSLPEIVSRNYLLKHQAIPERSRIGIEPGFFDVDASLQKHFANHRATYVPVMGNMCNSDGCPVAIGPDLSTELTTFDAGHLTNAASRYIARRLLLPEIENDSHRSN